MYVGLHHLMQILYCNETLCVCVCMCSQDLKLVVKQALELLAPSSLQGSKTQNFIACSLFLMSLFAYAFTSYGRCCACCSYSTRVEKEEVVTTQEHKNPTSKRNPRNSKPGKIYTFNIKQ